MDDVVEYGCEDGIGLLRVNRPASRNALNWAAQERFLAGVRWAAQQPGMRVLIVTGAGERAFVSGGDLKELVNHPEEAAGVRLTQAMGQALKELTQLPLPVIAAINGDAFGGGCEILSACDLRIAAAHARLSYAQINNGLVTGWGGTERLVRLIGQSRAMELLLTGRVLSAAEAGDIGLIHRIAPKGQDLLAVTRDWAGEIARLPSEALAATKALVQRAGTGNTENLSPYENQLFTKLWTSPDHLEAINAFVDKRQPRFNASG